MSSKINIYQCDKCMVKIDKEYLLFHKCEEDKYYCNLENKLIEELDRSIKLKIKNIELKNGIILIKKEINNSFIEMKNFINNYKIRKAK